VYIVAKAKVLAVGLQNKAEALRELPIRLINLQAGKEAASSFKIEQYDSVISHWRLADMGEGTFLRNLRGIRPDMPTIAVIEANNPAQEIAARSLGVSAVITEDCPDDHFREIVCSVLGLEKVEAITELYAIEEI
jgi:DNA-binding NarL/FixJ family response regulator